MDIAELLQHEERTAVEQYVRGQSKVVPAGGDRVLARVLGSFLMYLDMRDASMAPHLAMDGYWEMWGSIAVARYVKPGMRCIDVGASFGYYTLLLAQLVGDTGHVQAWEPFPEIHYCLAASVLVNGLAKRVEGIGEAASDQCREGVEFLTQGGRWGDTALDCAVVYEGSGRAGAPCVDCRPVDYANPKPVDFIKVDVSGHEAQVWTGTQQTLKRSPGVQLMVEFRPEKHEEPGAFLDQIDKDGFGTRLVADNGDLVLTNRADLCQPGVKLLWLTRR